ncbi:cyclase family protein [Nitrososphaera sp.]|uniref:cyclase family protein n=1 Tax=Nitrososphaera sp. TaxID=1971748 RepID=UPI00307F25E9
MRKSGRITAAATTTIIDLTMTVSASIKVFPSSPQPLFRPASTFDAHGYESETVDMSTHTGTHMDTPSHFACGKAPIDRIDASRFVARARLARLKKKAGETISAAEIGRVEEGDTIIIATGWEKHYEEDDYMTCNPGLSREAAEYLARKRVNAVGIDGPSIDPGHDAGFTAHNVLLPAGVLVIENLCNLDKIKNDTTRFTLVATPLKLAGASGSPIRALAILSDRR